MLKGINKKIRNIDLLNYPCTQIGISKLFADIFGDFVKYKENIYCIWNEEMGVWEDDHIEKINEIAKEFLSELLPRLVEQLEQSEKREYREFIRQHQNNASVSSILRCARSSPKMCATADDFDRESNYFNIKNCIVNAETGELLNHSKKYMITKMANVKHDPNIEDETWKRFIYKISNGDKAWCRYLVRVIAYILMGKPVDHCLFMLYGPTTRNGKSTLVNALLNFFGDYGTTIPPESLSNNRNRYGGAPSPDIARLVGKRFINVAESSKGLPLDVAFVKALTGGDTLAIRNLYTGYKDFINDGVFMLHTNHLPKVDDNTIFTSKRIIVIPFDKHIEPEEVDTNMLKKLTSENAKSGLLNMLVRAITKYQSIKEDQPQRVKVITQQYMSKGEIFGLFIETNIIKEHGSWVSTERIKKSYNAWAKRRGFESLTSNAITRELKKRGYIYKRKNNAGSGFKDIRLLKARKH